MRRSLQGKLILSYLVVALLTVLVVSVLIWLTFGQSLVRLVMQQQIADLTLAVQDYYTTNATLDGTGTGKGYMISPALLPTDPIPVDDGTAMYVRIDASSGTCSVYHRWDVKA